MAVDAFEQLLHGQQAAFGARCIERGLGLFGVGGFDFPAQNFAAKCGQVVLGGVGAAHEQDGPDVGPREILNEPGQQLDFGLWHGLGVVHDPDLRRAGLGVWAGGLFDRLACQRFVEAAEQGVGVGREVNLDAVLGRFLAQALQQQAQVVVEQGFVFALQRQAQAFAGDGVGAAVDAHAVGRAKHKVGQRRAVGCDGDVHAVAPWAVAFLPSGLNCMLGGTFTWGLGRAGFMGEAASRLKT